MAGIGIRQGTHGKPQQIRWSWGCGNVRKSLPSTCCIASFYTHSQDPAGPQDVTETPSLLYCGPTNPSWTTPGQANALQGKALGRVPRLVLTSCCTAAPGSSTASSPFCGLAVGSELHCRPEGALFCAVQHQDLPDSASFALSVFGKQGSAWGGSCAQKIGAHKGLLLCPARVRSTTWGAHAPPYWKQSPPHWPLRLIAQIQRPHQRPGIHYSSRNARTERSGLVSRPSGRVVVDCGALVASAQGC